MCETQWDTLAEIYLNSKDGTQEVFCVCSRVFVNTKDSVKSGTDLTHEFSASDEEQYNKTAAVTCDSITQDTNDIKPDVDTEVVSCYCSASHTDNISTDEHDSLRDQHVGQPALRGLQSSDSGTDLNEYLKHDCELAWQKYWSRNGETIIWKSWITKYSAYINPEYLEYSNSGDDKIVTQYSADSEDFCEGTGKLSEDSKPSKFSFETKEIEEFTATKESLVAATEHLSLKSGHEIAKKQEIALKNRILVRNLSGSDSYEKLHTDVSEGWNPLSPLSVECETEVERLLSPKCGCGSRASSSLRTLDSMTNVTRMTMSSVDLSSKNSDSFSSVSSIQSSLSSSVSDGIEDVEFEEQWNVLWKQHYEEEYLEQYKNFLFNISGSAENLHNKLVTPTNTTNKECSSPVKDTTISVLQMGDPIIGNVTNQDVFEPSESPQERVDSTTDDTLLHDSCAEEMTAMGLPLSFHSNFKRVDKKKMDSATTSMKRKSHEDSDDELAASNKIKAGFTLIGLEYKDDKGKRFLGHIDYKMKNIRFQNKHLRLHGDVPKPTHVYFDDDGNVCSETSLQQLPSDSSDVKETGSTTDEDIDKNKVLQLKDPSEKNDLSISKRKKRKKKVSSSLPVEIKCNRKLLKYWRKRYSLFSKFDEGIKLDEESWYSVTPEVVAKNIAERCKCDTIVDAFCGAGGNTIQFAMTCEHVIAIDIDPHKIELARHNAQVYGVADRIEFIVGDFLQLADRLRADVIFLSPPWGGPKYLKVKTYELENLQPVPFLQLLPYAMKVSKNVALFLPRNSNTYSLLVPESGGRVELVQNFINDKLVAISVYYNDLMSSSC